MKGTIEERIVKRAQ